MSETNFIEFVQKIFYSDGYFNIALVLSIFSILVLLTQFIFDKVTESVFGKFISRTYHEVINLSLKTLVVLFIIKSIDNKIFPWL